MADHRITIDRIATGGEGVGRDADGRVVFVSGALPGETVQVEITEQKKRFARGRALEIVSPSNDRRAEPCPYVSAGCGGCDWQHVAPAAQPALKASFVRDALVRIGKLADPVVEAGDPLPATGYRTTVRLAVLNGRAAYRKRASHDALAVDECLVAHPLIDELIADGVFPKAREVTLRCGARTGERLVLVDGPPKLVEVPKGVVVAGLRDVKEHGDPAHYHEEVAGRRWRISARSFFQARPDGAEALVNTVDQMAGDSFDGARVVDAYSGVGLFAAGAIREGAEAVIGIESAKSAIDDARHNVPEAAFELADVATWPSLECDIVVADPARAGLGPLAAGRLAATGAQLLVLVSCDAGSLGRDAGLLAEHGFAHEGSRLVDMFPNTSHVEIVSRFTRT